MFKVENGFANVSLAIAKERINQLIGSGFAPMTRDSETDLAEGTTVEGDVVSATLISNTETKQFFLSLRAKAASGRTFSLILPADKYQTCELGARIKAVVRRDTKGVGRFNLMEIAPVSVASPPVSAAF